MINGLVCAGIGFVVALIVVAAYSWVQSPFDVIPLLFDGMKAAGALGVPVVMWFGVQVAKRALLVNENRWRVEAQKIAREHTRKLHDIDSICDSTTIACEPILDALHADMSKREHVNLSHVLDKFENDVREWLENKTCRVIGEETQECFEESKSYLNDFKDRMRVISVSDPHAQTIWTELVLAMQGVQQAAERHTEKSLLNKSEPYKELVEVIEKEWIAIGKSMLGDKK